MPNYNLNVLGLEISFSTEAGEDRVRRALAHLEERFDELDARGRTVGKEKLLTFLALSLADDLLESEKRLHQAHNRLAQLVAEIDDATE